MSVSRRSILRGISLGAGATVLAPFLQRIALTADGRYQAPKRIIFVLQSNGFHSWAAQPKGIERTEAGPERVVDLPLEDYELSEDMKPLRSYRHKTTIIQRLHGVQCRPSHSAGFGALSGVRGRSTPVAETIDARLARLQPATFPLVHLGVNNASEDVEFDTKSGAYACCSAWGRDKPIYAQLDPNLAYKALFGAGAEKIDEGQGLLDEIRDDIKKVKSELRSAERAKFARHLDAFESLDQRKELFRQAASRPIDLEKAPKNDRRFTSSLESERLEAQFELTGAALISGLTNTATITSGACSTDGYFEGLGFDKAELHRIGHFRDFNKQSWKEIYIELRQFHFRLIADLVEKLTQASDEDGSSMMNNTLIVYTSDGADTHHSKGREWPFVIIGNWGGKIRSGRFLEYPAFGQTGNRIINSLYCSLLHAAGVEQESFNLSQEEYPDQEGPLPELVTS